MNEIIDDFDNDFGDHSTTSFQQLLYYMNDVIGKMIKKIVDKQLDTVPINYDKIIKDLKKLKKEVKSGMVIDSVIEKTL